MTYEHVPSLPNESSRLAWIEDRLSQLAQVGPNRSLLDVGAGTGRWKSFATDLGLTYRSQDFSKYIPSSDIRGLHDSSFDYPTHDYVCDILEIPKTAGADIVLCSEVLEHVPDPVAAFRKVVSLVKPKGTLLVTVPFQSLMHQAPFYFSSGLSPYWFSYWAENFGMDEYEICLLGDHIDVVEQEIGRILNRGPYSGWRAFVHSKRVASVQAAVRLLARNAAPDVRFASAHTTTFVGSLA